MENNLDERGITRVRIYYTPSPLRYALTIKDPVGSGTTM
jgi:hypothetical protein